MIRIDNMETSRMHTERSGGWLEAWSLTSTWCYYFYEHMGPMYARYVYGILFLIGNTIAWGLRENPTLFFLIQKLRGCQGSRNCFAAEAVLIPSITLFIFFFAMTLSTVYTTSVHDLRSAWHCKRWELKILLVGIFFVASMFAPTQVTHLYGLVAPFGGGLFLLIQLVSVIRLITQLNSRWCGQANFDNHRCKVNTIAILAYGSSMVGIILMVFFYVSSYFNVALIVTTLALVYILPGISLLTKAKGFYMEALLMGVYIVFMCWLALKSEPDTSSYKKENSTGSGVNWKTMISFIAGLASATVAAFSTGTDYKYIQFRNVVESENDPPYGYGFFHLVFASGSMYFGMMLLGWDTHHVSSARWSMDVSRTSTIVHIVNEGLAVLLFAVVVLARAFGPGWLRQLLAQTFGIGGQQLAEEFPATATVPASFEIDNNGPPQEPRVPDEHVEIEMGNIGPSQRPQTTEPMHGN